MITNHKKTALKLLGFTTRADRLYPEITWIVKNGTPIAMENRKHDWIFTSHALLNDKAAIYKIFGPPLLDQLTLQQKSALKLLNCKIEEYFEYDIAYVWANETHTDLIAIIERGVVSSGVDAFKYPRIAEILGLSDVDYNAKNRS